MEERNKRSQKEERRLWRMLEECDKEQAREEERKVKRDRRKVQQARQKMKVRKDQPSMKDMLKVSQPGCGKWRLCVWNSFQDWDCH